MVFSPASASPHPRSNSIPSYGFSLIYLLVLKMPVLKNMSEAHQNIQRKLLIMVIVLL